MYAISSAGVAFAVTRACSSGELEKCGCDRTVHGVSPQGKQRRGRGRQGPGNLAHTHWDSPPRPLPPRLPVVGMLGQHRLRRGLLPVVCGCAREKQGGLIQPGPHEPPQQRGRQEGSVVLPTSTRAGTAGQGPEHSHHVATQETLRVSPAQAAQGVRSRPGQGRWRTAAHMRTHVRSSSPVTPEITCSTMTPSMPTPKVPFPSYHLSLFHRTLPFSRGQHLAHLSPVFLPTEHGVSAGP